MVTTINTIAEEVKSLIAKFPQNRTQLLKENAFDVKAFGWITYTFADGSNFKEVAQ